MQRGHNLIGSTRASLIVRRRNLVEKLYAMVGQTFGTWKVLACIDTTIKRGRFTACCTVCGFTKTKQGDQLRAKVPQGCRQCSFAAMRLPGSAQRDLLRRYIVGAHKRGLVFDLSDQQFNAMILLPCTYCGTPPDTKFEYRGKIRFTYSGVDRVDSAAGYTLANAVPCCNMCNKAKRALPVAVFLAWLDRVVIYRRG